MKAAVVYGADDIRVEEYPDPSAGPEEVIVKTKAAGISSKDINIMLGHGLSGELPVVLGCDLAGEISEVGEGVTGLDVGESVAVYPAGGPGQGLGGAYAEYVRVPKEIVSVGGVVRLDETISFEDAALTEPLARSFAAARANRMKENQTILIIGGGSAGLMHLKTAKWSGCKIIAADLIDTRLAMAGQMGAHHLINPGKKDLYDEVMRITKERGADLVIISVTIPDVIESCLKMVAKGGVCNVFSTSPGTEPGVDQALLDEQNITLTGICISSPVDFKKSLQLIKEEAIIVSDMISHRFTLDTFHEAVEAAKRQELVRGIITFGEMLSVSF